MNQFSPAQIIHADETTLLQSGLSKTTIQSIQTPNWKRIEKDIKWAENPAHHILFLTDENYPYLLREIPDPPLFLYVKGNVEALHFPQIAMVGSRNPSHSGNENALEFSASLAKIGFCISSGLAIGVDTCAHLGALKNGGKTIAVLGSGLEDIYPKQNTKLAEEIIRQGALVSEFPLTASPKPWHFPRRNRIISGLSLGVLVVEASLRSGSLITARLASEQGREVFVIPGSIHNPLAKGCHQLLRHGAKLVDKIEDILEELNPIIGAINKPVDEKPNKMDHMGARFELDPTHKVLLDYFEYETITIDQLVGRSGLSAAEISAKLLLLEVNGYIKASPGGYIKVK